MIITTEITSPKADVIIPAIAIPFAFSPFLIDTMPRINPTIAVGTAK